MYHTLRVIAQCCLLWTTLIMDSIQKCHKWNRRRGLFVKHHHSGYYGKYKHEWYMILKVLTYPWGNRHVSNHLRQKAEVKIIFCSNMEVMNSGCGWSIGQGIWSCYEEVECDPSFEEGLEVNKKRIVQNEWRALQNHSCVCQCVWFSSTKLVGQAPLQIVFDSSPLLLWHLSPNFKTLLVSWIIYSWLFSLSLPQFKPALPCFLFPIQLKLTSHWVACFWSIFFLIAHRHCH